MPTEQAAAQAVKADPGAGLLTRPGHKQLLHLLAPTVPCIVRSDSQYQGISLNHIAELISATLFADKSICS